MFQYCRPLSGRFAESKLRQELETGTTFQSFDRGWPVRSATRSPAGPYTEGSYGIVFYAKNCAYDGGCTP